MEFTKDDRDRMIRMETQLDCFCDQVKESVEDIKSAHDSLISENKKSHTSIHEKINKNSNDITVLKVKSSIWGAISGAITSVVALAFAWLIRSGGGH